MSDPKPGERLYPVAAAIERETGIRPPPATWHRWRLGNGCRPKLATTKVGGKRYTSREAVQRWVAACNQQADQVPSPRPAKRTTSCPRNGIDQVLDEEGL